MPMQIQPLLDPMAGDVTMAVLDNDGFEKQIIDENLPSAFRVVWEVRGPAYWAYAIGDSVWRIRIGVESFGPATEHSFPTAGTPAHTVAAIDGDVDDVAKVVRWTTEVPVPAHVYDTDVVYKAVAAVDFKVDPLIDPLAAPVAGFAEGSVFQTKEDPQSP